MAGTLQTTIWNVCLNDNVCFILTKCYLNVFWGVFQGLNCSTLVLVKPVRRTRDSQLSWTNNGPVYWCIQLSPSPRVSIILVREMLWMEPIGTLALLCWIFCLKPVVSSVYELLMYFIVFICTLVFTAESMTMNSIGTNHIRSAQLIKCFTASLCLHEWVVFSFIAP